MRRIAVILCPAILLSQGAIEEAKRVFDAGQFERAIRLFESSGDKGCEVSFYVGLSHYKLGQLDPAIIRFEQSAECSPKDAQFRVALAEAYALKGDTARALDSYEAALRLQPALPQALEGAAALYLRLEKNDRAAELLRRSVDGGRKDPRTLAHLAAALAATSRQDEAEKLFRQALTGEPNHVSALTGLGNVLLRTNRADEAVTPLKRAAELNPGAYEPLFLLGQAASQSGRSAEALAYFEKASRLAPDEPEVVYQLGLTYGKLGRPDDRSKAIARFQALKAERQRQEQAERDSAQLIAEAAPLVSENRLNEAAALLERAVEVRPKNADAWFRLASLQYDLQRYDAALISGGNAVKLSPGQWMYHLLLGLTRKAKGQWNESRKALLTAIQLNGQSADTLNQLGDVEMRLGDPAQAAIHFEQAQRLSPDDPAYRINLEAARAAILRRGSR